MDEAVRIPHRHRNLLFERRDNGARREPRPLLTTDGSDPVEGQLRR